MERNANYALVGLISTILLMGLLVFIVWLAGSGLARQYDLYDIVFQGPVRGLSQGAEVHFNGIKVGEVSKITLDPKDTRLVIARAQVTSDVPIRVDSYATLAAPGHHRGELHGHHRRHGLQAPAEGHRAQRPCAGDVPAGATPCRTFWPAADTSSRGASRRSTG